MLHEIERSASTRAKSIKDADVSRRRCEIYEYKYKVENGFSSYQNTLLLCTVTTATEEVSFVAELSLLLLLKSITLLQTS